MVEPVKQENRKKQFRYIIIATLHSAFVCNEIASLRVIFHHAEFSWNDYIRESVYEIVMVQTT